MKNVIVATSPVTKVYVLGIIRQMEGHYSKIEWIDEDSPYAVDERLWTPQNIEGFKKVFEIWKSENK